MKKFIAVLKILVANPINRMRLFPAFIRFFKWQIGSWLVPGKVLIPWINGSRIFAGFMMSGSAGCAYSGLHEFEEMAFVLHFLRKDDLFMDVGANVGVFTVLAGKAVGARCVSVEPGADAYAHLLDNVLINQMGERVQTVKACVSNEDAVCMFTQSSESTWSHIAASADEAGVVEVPTYRIDSILDGKVPTLLKMDVEGFEKQALEGAVNTLGNNALKAVLLEIGSHSLRYGIEPEEIHEMMLKHGFRPCYYEPFTRVVSGLDSYAQSDNTLYLRDAEWVEKRLREGESFCVFGQEI